ncbi:MAG: DUF2344 domain-containing protein [Clostridia bacterium]|nr:DUF2344 domain-containing protein [Clostridia bacterium]
MSKYRIQYTQGDSVKFISHLDFLRTINRVFMRAKAPVKFSNGFNPHLVMTIGLPLSVGTTSVCDVLDIELTQQVNTDEFMQQLNDTCPMGIAITAVKPAEGLKPLFNIDSAIYQAKFDTDKPIDIQKYIDEPSIMIEKKSKRGMNLVNIKDFIRSMEIVCANDCSYCISMHINAGNFSNLKPELVLSSMCSYFDCTTTNTDIERKNIFFDDGTPVF